MEVVSCPFCGAEVSMAEVDKNAGSCPECDALITGSLLFDDIGDDDEELFEDDDEELIDDDDEELIDDDDEELIDDDDDLFDDDDDINDDDEEDEIDDDL